MNRLYNYQTGKYEIVPDEMAAQGLVNGAYGFPSDKPVKLLDQEGQIVEVSPREALTEMSLGDNSNYTWYSGEAQEADRVRDEYGDMAGTAFVEGVADSLTVGAYPSIAEAVNLTTAEDIKLRAEHNPKASMAGAGAGIVGSFYSPLGPLKGLQAFQKFGQSLGIIDKGWKFLGSGVRLVDKVGVKVADGLIKGATALKNTVPAFRSAKDVGKAEALAKAAKAAGWTESITRGAIQGGVDSQLYNLFDSLNETIVGDPAFTAEALKANIAQNSVEAGKIGVIGGGFIGALAKATQSTIKYLDDKHKDWIKTHYNDVPNSKMDNLPSDKINDALGFDSQTTAVHFTVAKNNQGEPVLRLKYGDRYLPLDEAEKLDIIDFNNSNTIDEIADYLRPDYAEIMAKESWKKNPTLDALIDKENAGFTNISDKELINYTNLEAQRDELVSKVQGIDSKISGASSNINKFLGKRSLNKQLDLFEEARLGEYYKNRNNLRKTLSDTKDRLGRIQKKIDDFNETHFGDAVTVNRKAIQKLIEAKDGIRIGNNIYITKIDKLSHVRGTTLGRPKISAAQDSIFSLIGVGKGQRKKLRPMDAKRMESGIRSIVRELTGGRFGKIKVAKQVLRTDKGRIESFVDVAEERLVKASRDMEDVQNAIHKYDNDVFRGTGKYSTGITYGALKTRIKNKLDGLLNKTEIPSTMDRKEVKHIQDELESMFADKNLSENVRAYDLRKGSINYRNEGYKHSPFTDGYMAIKPKASRAIGETLEDIYQEHIKQVAPKKVFQKYKNARDQYATYIGIRNTLEDKIAGRVTRGSIGFSDIMTTASIGIGIDPFLGLGTNLLRRSTPEMKAFYMLKITKENDKWYKRVDEAAKGFLESGLIKSAIMGIATSDELLLSYKPDYIASSLEEDIESFAEDNPALIDFLPETSTELVGKFNKSKQLIESALPQETDVDKIPEVSTIQSYEHRKAARIQHLIKNPQKMLKEISMGYITNETSQIMDELYPATKNLLIERLVEQMGSAYLSPSQKSQLKKLFKESADPTLTVEGYNMLQLSNKNMGLQAQQEQAPTSARPFKKRPLSDRTDNERRLTR